MVNGTDCESSASSPAYSVAKDEDAPCDVARHSTSPCRSVASDGNTTQSTTLQKGSSLAFSRVIRSKSQSPSVTSATNIVNVTDDQLRLTEDSLILTDDSLGLAGKDGSQLNGANYVANGSSLLLHVRYPSIDTSVVVLPKLIAAATVDSFSDNDMDTTEEEEADEQLVTNGSKNGTSSFTNGSTAQHSRSNYEAEMGGLSICIYIIMYSIYKYIYSNVLVFAMVLFYKV